LFSTFAFDRGFPPNRYAAPPPPPEVAPVIGGMSNEARQKLEESTRMPDIDPRLLIDRELVEKAAYKQFLADGVRTYVRKLLDKVRPGV
jgi:hypothetical protein